MQAATVIGFHMRRIQRQKRKNPNILVTSKTGTLINAANRLIIGTVFFKGPTFARLLELEFWETDGNVIEQLLQV